MPNSCPCSYYGSDCSNSTCPGTHCYYDADRRQHCTHCCTATTNQTSGYDFGVQSYRDDVRKVPCSQRHPGEEHGTCDGFGMCQCAPPYLGEDCSMQVRGQRRNRHPRQHCACHSVTVSDWPDDLFLPQDCASNCSGHGFCSVEYPLSRCICTEGWTGLTCDYEQCLNNCSYPNGVCVNGSCYCAMTYSPYNRTREYFPWMGDDCSWRAPYAASVRAALGNVQWLAVAAAMSFMVLWHEHRPSIE